MKTKNILDKTNSPKISNISQYVYKNNHSKNNSVDHEYNSKFKSEYRPCKTEFFNQDDQNRQENRSKNKYMGIIDDWKEKYYILSNENEKLKLILNREKLKTKDFENLKNLYENSKEELTKFRMKVNNYNDEKEQINFKYHQSESIRIEQSRLIQSLKNEVDKLLNLTATKDAINKTKEIVEEKIKDNSDEEKTSKEKKIKKKKKNTNTIKSKSVSKTKKI